MADFDGSTAVVTGAASGIGRALADALAAEGARLVLADVEAGPLEAVAAAVPTEAVALACDVSDPTACARVADTAFERFGAVHLLVNNAGVIGRFAPVWDQDPDDWQWLFGVNVFGTANMLRAFVPRMIGQRVAAHIVNVASEAAFVPRPFVGVYHASKHAVLALTETLAQELTLEDADLRVSVVCPGGVNTRVLDAARNRPQTLAPMRDDGAAGAGLRASYRAALERALSPEQVAGRILDGVRAGRFYIFPHPEIADLAEVRARAVATGDAPAVDPALAQRLSTR